VVLIYEIQITKTERRNDEDVNEKIDLLVVFHLEVSLIDGLKHFPDAQPGRKIFR